ncbi:DUF58 domain-containing protein [Paenibacillus sp. Leaf72]|uniref:DUF58 domain-containing protein n=1 Tax=Paenibacillus sp. Leaf72 TaxID=1736234 RepID=UPI0006FA4354|nr:DUF58 domain-containing protein [Paenibacillus sp. Leaf72]KQO04334.1 hypothetical protein ASF12_12345 [Paenibacillus sp. Leaf72]
MNGQGSGSGSGFQHSAFSGALAKLFPDSSLLHRLERMKVAAGSRVKGSMAGKRRSSTLGGSQEFADYRPYAPGDDIRRLDWNVYGRTGRAYMRQYWDEQELTLHVYVDVSPSMNFGGEQANKLRCALQLAASGGYAALSGEDRVAVKLFGGTAPAELPSLRGRGSTARLFHFLAAALERGMEQPSFQQGEELKPSMTGLGRAMEQQAAALSMREAIQQAGQLPHRTGVTWVVSDAMYEAGIEETLLSLLAARQQVVFLHLLSPEELNPALTGELNLLDSELGTGKEVALGSRLLEQYCVTVNDYCSHLKKLCAERGALYIFIDTSKPMEQTVQHTLLRAGVLHSHS